MGHVRLGSAAGCDAVAMPRRRVAIHLWAMPLGAAFGPITLGLSPDQGLSPRIIWQLSAGQSHRREANSGGKAEPDMPE